MMEDISHSQITRREFASRSLKAGAAVAATAGAAWWLHDSLAPPSEEIRQNVVSLPDFSIPRLSRTMSIVTGSDRVKTVAKGLEAIGGIGAFRQKGRPCNAPR